MKILETTGDSEVSVELAEKKLEDGSRQQGVRFKVSGKKVGFGNGNTTLETGSAKARQIADWVSLDCRRQYSGSTRAALLFAKVGARIGAHHSCKQSQD